MLMTGKQFLKIGQDLNIFSIWCKECPSSVAGLVPMTSWAPAKKEKVLIKLSLVLGHVLFRKAHDAMRWQDGPKLLL